MTARVHQSRSEIGMTVSMIDAIIGIARVLKQRMDTIHPEIGIGRKGDKYQPIREALRDLNDCNEFRGLIEHGDREAMAFIHDTAERYRRSQAVSNGQRTEGE